MKMDDLGGNTSIFGNTHLKTVQEMGHYPLVGGFNPSEKYARQIGFIFPNSRGENKHIWVATTQ